MIERVHSIMDRYAGLTVLHTYTTTIDPRTLKQLTEHVVVCIYDKRATVKEYTDRREIDIRA